jgi:hypothetical protein
MLKSAASPLLVAHAYNPNYSGSRDQEDCRLKPAQANSSTRPYLEKPFTKIGLVEWLKVKALSSIPSNVKKKKGAAIVYLYENRRLCRSLNDPL